ncbi:MAG: SDR family NAD(P)-dependent oxidoreductase [Leptothrix sp. (in: b-proteobacteria)]
MACNPLMREWRGQVVWVIGASSGIGLATAERLAAAGAQVLVSARQPAPLAAFAARHPGAIALPLDVCDAASVQAAACVLRERVPQLDLVLYCAGHYKPQRATAFDLAEMLRHQQINYVGALHCLDVVLAQLLAQGHGHLSLVASVAGYRGLPNALAYGPTKAALILLAETLYLDLAPRRIGVSVINPGFVATPLTAQNDFRMPALITPEQAAQAMLDGWARGQFEIHFPRRFSRLLKALGLLNDRLYFAAVRRLTGG